MISFDPNAFVAQHERRLDHPSRRLPVGPRNRYRGNRPNYQPEAEHFQTGNRSRNVAHSIPPTAPPQQEQDHLQGSEPVPPRGGKVRARGRGYVRGAPPRRGPSQSQLKQYVLGEDVACPQCSKSIRKSDGKGYQCPKCRLDEGGWLINRAQEKHGNLN